jgi:hypothetical protein
LTTAPIPTDNPGTVAVLPEEIPILTPGDLLTRLHARFSAVESTAANVAARVEAALTAVLDELKKIAHTGPPVVIPIADAVAAFARGNSAPAARAVAKVAAVVGALCADCSHTAKHTRGGCTEPGCSCKTPPPPKR